MHIIYKGNVISCYNDGEKGNTRNITYIDMNAT